MKGGMMELSPILWLIQLFTNYDKRRMENAEKRHRELFQETFNQMKSIDTQYRSMLRECENKLPKYANEHVPTPGWYLDGVKISHDELAANCEKARQHWTQAREEKGAERVLLRSRAQQLVSMVDSDKERRFVYTVINYFLHPECKQGSIEAVDVTVRDLLFRGADIVLDSPSLTLAEKISGINDPDEIRQILEKQRSDLASRWRDICDRYNELDLDHTVGRE